MMNIVSYAKFLIQKLWTSSEHNVSDTAHSTLAEAPVPWHMDSYDKLKLYRNKWLH